MNKNIREYYAQSQELRRKIEFQIRKKKLGDRVINSDDRFLVKHFILGMRQDIK